MGFSSKMHNNNVNRFAHEIHVRIQKIIPVRVRRIIVCGGGGGIVRQLFTM